MSKDTTTILWDWNGTLLNDIEQSLATMNELLYKRNLPALSQDRYKQIFDFPVYDYYQLLGFDFSKEDWSEVATEYMDGYHNKEEHLTLFECAREVLWKLRAKDYKHYILSAMKTDSIKKMLETFEITHLFDGVYGLDNHYANGKIEVGQQLLEKEKIAPENCLLVGDTTHDAQVALSIGVPCVLIANGHHSLERLQATNNEIFNCLCEFLNKF